MSILAIQAALEKHLLVMTPIATAFENKVFGPQTGVPYQRIAHLLNNPRDVSIERDLVRLLGVFQVSLFYPLDGGRVPAMERAEAICAQFAPVLLLQEGGVTVEIDDTPSIAGAMSDGDRWHVPVSINWSSFVAR